MTNKRDDFSVSRLELVVLARYSAAKTPGIKELASAVKNLALPKESDARVKSEISEVQEALRQRGLLTAKKRTASRLSEAGEQTLRKAFSLSQTPTWKEISNRHLPALGLKLRPGSEDANHAFREGSKLFAEVLRVHFGLARAASFTAICDALIIDELKLQQPPPERMTLAWLRTQVLAKRTGKKPEGSPEEMARSLAAEQVGAKGNDARSLAAALSRRWITDQADHKLEPAPVSVSVQQGSNGGKQPPQNSNQTTLPHPSNSSAGRPVPSEPSPEMLLKVVREVLPRVGADGRFGTEKVFVSAIWRGIEHDQRVEGMSFDRFKRWLLTANRQSQLVLARADLVTAMDRKQVSESEIVDQGSTFHFVLDKQPNPGSERRSHAR